jgi:hypothetical protein
MVFMVGTLDERELLRTRQSDAIAEVFIHQLTQIIGNLLSAMLVGLHFLRRAFTCLQDDIEGIATAFFFRSQSMSDTSFRSFAPSE